MPKKIWATLFQDATRLYRLLPPRLKASYWLILARQVSFAVVETVTLLAISLFAMSVAAPEAVINNSFVKLVFKHLPFLAELCASPRRLVAFASLLMVLAVALKAGLNIWTTRGTSLFSEKVTLYIGREAIRRYLNQSYYWHISPESADVIHRVTNRFILATFLLQMLLLHSNVVCCLFLFVSLLIAQPKLTLAVMLCFSMASLLVFLTIRRNLDRASQVSADTWVEENATTTALTKGIREIISYRQQETTLNKMMAAAERGLPARTYLAFSSTVTPQIMEFVGFSTIGVIVVLLLAGRMPMEEIVSAASILMLTAWRILPAVNRSLSYTVALRGLKPRALMCLELLETFSHEKAEPLPEPDPGFRFSRDLSLVDAVFRYPHSEAQALDGATLTVRKGQSAGLVGPSGAGKSTLALLLSGLCPPASGRFLVDGAELTPAGLSASLAKVGSVPQNPLLMDGTLGENVAFSQWGRPYDRARAAEACRLAAIDFVAVHPLGLDLPLNSTSSSLSGGQAQRVAIARALFPDPEVVIFDEATSALDQANENIIKATIARIKGRITSIIIAHRLTTVEDCDVLFWIDHGQVKAFGPPSDIIPRYAAFIQAEESRREASDAQNLPQADNQAASSSV
jgi:ABC-type multidrug transport system fused ATPase/permease subunit